MVNFDGGGGFNEVATTFEKGDGDGGGNVEPARTRAYFPETWLYDSMVIPDGSTETITLTAPDTITSWMLSGVSVSSATGKCEITDVLIYSFSQGGHRCGALTSVAPTLEAEG